MRSALAALALLWAGSVPAMEWQADTAVPMQVQVAETMAAFRASNPALGRFFDEACGVAVFPRVVRFGLAFGAGGGRGLLISAGSVQGEVSQSAFSMGLQAGGQSFRQLIFFRNCEAMREFTHSGNLGPVSGRVEMAGRASAQAGGSGAFSDAGITPDIALFSLSRTGLMLDLSAAGVRYRFTPAASR